MPRRLLPCVCGLLAAASAFAADAPPTFETAYPGLLSGVLAHATLGELPDGVVLRSGAIEVAKAKIDDLVANAPKDVREGIRKCTLLMLEELVTERILLVAARQAAAKAGRDVAGKTDGRIIRDYLQAALGEAKVTDAEIADFYGQNKSMFEGSSLDKVKDSLRQYLLDEKWRAAVAEHIRGIGKSVPIVVSAAWAKGEAALARDNPVDQARTSGLPSLVDFGATGCRPCDMLAPILKTLTKKFRGKLNVLFIHVGKEKALASRYGISSIPVQVFFDKDGREVFRHVGFFAQDAIERKLAEMGVQ